LIDHDPPIWDPPSIRFEKYGLAIAIERGIDLVRQLINDYQEGLFFGLLNMLVSQSDELSKARLIDLIPVMKNEAGLLARLTSLLGLGRGLTPAGDDFLVGFLLASFYFYKNAALIVNEPNINQQIAAEVQKRTTTLSAALIQCAALGEGDERLLDALRWIAQGDTTIAHARASLLSYGSSSGVDALAGMLTALYMHDFEQL